MKRPLILVTNDDGINAPGIRSLIAAASEIGETVVVAPEKPQSGMSHAVTIAEPLRIKKIISSNGHTEYSCSGTPADCIKIGINKILNTRPDLILSGINHGSNASVNIIYSGTMAAVLEGTMNSIPSIGFSLDDYSHSADFSFVKPYIKKIIENVLEQGLPEGIGLNVNIPAVDPKLIGGIKICRQAKAYWSECFDERLDPHNRHYYWLTGVFTNQDEGEETDEWALRNNMISVVPVHCDFTAHKFIDTIKKWNFDV